MKMFNNIFVSLLLLLVSQLHSMSVERLKRKSEAPEASQGLESSLKVEGNFSFPEEFYNSPATAINLTMGQRKLADTSCVYWFEEFHAAIFRISKYEEDVSKHNAHQILLASALANIISFHQDEKTVKFHKEKGILGNRKLPIDLYHTCPEIMPLIEKLKASNLVECATRECDQEGKPTEYTLYPLDFDQLKDFCSKYVASELAKHSQSQQREPRRSSRVKVLKEAAEKK